MSSARVLRYQLILSALGSSILFGASPAYAGHLEGLTDVISVLQIDTFVKHRSFTGAIHATGATGTETDEDDDAGTRKATEDPGTETDEDDAAEDETEKTFLESDGAGTETDEDDAGTQDATDDAGAQADGDDDDAADDEEDDIDPASQEDPYHLYGDDDDKEKDQAEGDEAGSEPDESADKPVDMDAQASSSDSSSDGSSGDAAKAKAGMDHPNKAESAVPNAVGSPFIEAELAAQKRQAAEEAEAAKIGDTMKGLMKVYQKETAQAMQGMGIPTVAPEFKNAVGAAFDARKNAKAAARNMAWTGIDTGLNPAKMKEIMKKISKLKKPSTGSEAMDAGPMALNFNPVFNIHR